MADAYGCLPDHDLQQADAEQAYIQATLEGEEVVFVALTSFDVLDFYEAPDLRATVAELRPRRGSVGRTIDQVIGQMKGSHLDLIDLMIDELLIRKHFTSGVSHKTQCNLAASELTQARPRFCVSLAR